MEIEKIYSEKAEEDIWSSLLKFTYTENLKRFFNDRQEDVNEDLIETISGSISQAYEYFSVSKNASLQVSPLLLYYGATNLLYGVSCLLTGEVLKIENHGMKIEPSLKNQQVAETTIRFSDSLHGGVSVYLKSLTDIDLSLPETSTWTVKECLGSLVEIIPDFVTNYGNNDLHVIPLKKFKAEKEEHFRIIIGVNGTEKLQELIKNIPDFCNNYLPPQLNNLNEIILRKKINGNYLHQLSYTGQPFLSIGHKKKNNDVVLPYFLYLFIVLFSFGTLCRYHPEKWNPFVQNDNTGEKNLIEKFIHISRRQLPNLMLNIIFKKEFLFNNDMYKDIDSRSPLNKEEIRKLIIEELNNRRV